MLYGKENWDICKMIKEYKIVPINLYNHLENFNNLVKLLDQGENNLSEKDKIKGYWNENDDDNSIF